MSLPSFPDKDKMPTREEAINQIISSIAMEELGLSHIINAEGEKLQYALGTLEDTPGPNVPLTVEDLLKLNESVHNTLNSNMMNQFFLKEKLTKALAASVMQGPTGPTGPEGPQGEIGPTGPAGLGLNILGVYETVAEMEEALGTGEMGDVAVAEGFLYISNGLSWQIVDNLGGPTGPAWQPDQPLFEVSGTTGDTGTVGYEGGLNFISDTLDISVDTGPTVKIEIPTPHSGAIIPFASGTTLTISTGGSGVTRGVAGIIGFGNGGTLTVPADLSSSITLTEADLASSHFAFPMPVDGRITSMTFYCSAYGPSGIVSRNSLLTARLYYSESRDNVFQPIPGAEIPIEIPGLVFTTEKAYRSGINNALSIPVRAEGRLLFLIDYQLPGYFAKSEVRAHFGGSIRIE